MIEYKLGERGHTKHQCPYCGWCLYLSKNFLICPSNTLVTCRKCHRIIFFEFLVENNIGVNFSLERPDRQAIINYQPYVFNYISYEGNQMKIKTILNRS